MLVVGLLAMLCSGMTAADEAGQGYTKNPLIEPGKSYEACLKLSTGDKLHYTLTSVSALRFNIHYHHGSEVRYPVPVRLTSTEKSVFEADASNLYCLMWNNPGREPVELELHYRKQAAVVHDINE